MPLKLSVGDLNEVPEALRGLYRERREGGFILDVEGGAVAKSTLDEFRTKNVELLKRIDSFGGVDPATLREENTQLRSDLEKARAGAAADAEARFKAVEQSRDTYRQRLEAVVIDQQVMKVAATLGAHPTAIEDVATRIRPRFRLDESGSPFATDAQGQKIYGEDGKPLGIDGAVRQLTRQAPHLFRQSGGGAAHPSGGAGRFTPGASNPWKKESFNITEQGRILKQDRGEAERLAAEAGTTL